MLLESLDQDEARQDGDGEGHLDAVGAGSRRVGELQAGVADDGGQRGEDATLELLTDGGGGPGRTHRGELGGGHADVGVAAGSTQVGCEVLTDGAREHREVQREILAQHPYGAHAPVNRVIVLGRGGAGKSTLAVALGQRTGLPVVELDAHLWSPRLEPLTAQEWSLVQDLSLVRCVWRALRRSRERVDVWW